MFCYEGVFSTWDLRHRVGRRFCAGHVVLKRSSQCGPWLSAWAAITKASGDKGPNLFAILFAAILSWELEKSKSKGCANSSFKQTWLSSSLLFVFFLSQNLTEQLVIGTRRTLYYYSQRNWGRIYDSKSDLAVLRVKHKRNLWWIFFQKKLCFCELSWSFEKCECLVSELE